MKYNRAELIKFFNKRRDILLKQEKAFLLLQAKEIAVNNKKAVEFVQQWGKEIRGAKDVRNVPGVFYYTTEQLNVITGRLKSIKDRIERINAVLERINLLCGKECIDVNKDLEHDIDYALHGNALGLSLG